MVVFRHRNFKKQYKKLPKKVQKKFQEKISVFMKNPHDPRLNNHILGGSLNKYRSIDITGDFRALYEVKGEKVVFVKIGSHSELYG
jgi:addiction module RelE/StbE family toxin